MQSKVVKELVGQIMWIQLSSWDEKYEYPDLKILQLASLKGFPLSYIFLFKV